MKKQSRLYKILRPLIVFFTKVFLHPKYEGLENIPSSGRVILAGTHKSIFDPFALVTSTKRQIHFLSKKELFDGPFGFIFKNMGLIKVDRKKHSVDAITPSIEYLNKSDRFVNSTTTQTRVSSSSSSGSSHSGFGSSGAGHISGGRHG